jgi:hypothetical protein
MMKLKGLWVIPVIAFLSCNRPQCYNSNQVFEKLSPETFAYKDALAEKLKQADASKLRYWLSGFHDDPTAPYLIVHVQGDSLCASMSVFIKESRKGIEDLLATKGTGYHGAELEGLKFEVIEDSIGVQFVFREIKRVLD